jgi:hypothetical protein
MFADREQPKLLPAPVEVYDVPIYTTAKVHRDHHIEVATALLSAGELDRHQRGRARRPVAGAQGLSHSQRSGRVRSCGA